jgi:transcriptional regulator with XRE-family HTH domain
MVARLTGANAISAAQLARESGVTQQNLSQWLSEARNLPFVPSGNSIALHLDGGAEGSNHCASERAVER